MRTGILYSRRDKKRASERLARMAEVGDGLGIAPRVEDFGPVESAEPQPMGWWEGGTHGLNLLRRGDS